MKQAFFCVSMLALTGCMGATTDTGLPANFYVADDPLPPEVSSNLPADVARSDILARVNPGDIGACYFYRHEGKIYPLTTVDMVKAGFDGQPYCIS